MTDERLGVEVWVATRVPGCRDWEVVCCRFIADGPNSICVERDGQVEFVSKLRAFFDYKRAVERVHSLNNGAFK